MTGRTGRLGWLRRNRDRVDASAQATVASPRARGIRPYLRPAVETLLAGALAGYLIGVVVGEISPAPSGTAPGETREAHAFIGALYRNDLDTQAALMTDRDLLGRALQLKATAEGLEGASFRSVTFLGGETRGRLSIQMYALEARTDDGRQGLVPYTLTMGNGKVIRIV
jgi:hypothetical protein